MDRNDAKLRRAQEVQLNRPAKVLKGAHFPRKNTKPKDPVAPVQVVIEDDIILKETIGRPISNKLESPMKYGDVDRKPAVAVVSAEVISEETTEAEPGVVSEEISASETTDEQVAE